MNQEDLLENFKTLVKSVESEKGYKKPLAFGIARVDRGQLDKNKTLQANFAIINWEENYGSAAVFVEVLRSLGVSIDFNESEFVYTIKKKFIKNALKIFAPFLDDGKEHKNIQVLQHLEFISKNEGLKKNYKLVFIFEDKEPKSVESVYLKLYALSQSKVKLRSLNLNGAFGVLENVAWSMGYPYELEWLRQNEVVLKLDGTYPLIESVDKFPRFLQHVIPQNNTRILDASKVRMGAQLAAGTTIMPGASYVNFNAGTTGSVMVEGRISSSAIVGEGSDVGGGASILGVLSGTNGNAIEIGKNTLLGANSVTGIPLGNGCIVDAGLAILEGTKVLINQKQAKLINEVNPTLKLDTNKKEITIKALDLANAHGIHFRQNSLNGCIQALRSQRQIVLNSQLH